MSAIDFLLSTSCNKILSGESEPEWFDHTLKAHIISAECIKQEVNLTFGHFKTSVPGVFPGNGSRRTIVLAVLVVSNDKYVGRH